MVGDNLQTPLNGLIANRGPCPSGPHPMLGHHVRDPEIWLDRHQLHRSEAEVVGRPSPVPTPVLPLGLRPVAGERQHESLSPSAEVIADVGDDLVAFDLWGGRITLDNPQRLHAAMVTWTIPLVHPRATLATSTFHAFRRDEDGILAIVLGHAVDLALSGGWLASQARMTSPWQRRGTPR